MLLVHMYTYTPVQVKVKVHCCMASMYSHINLAITYTTHILLLAPNAIRVYKYVQFYGPIMLYVKRKA